LCRTSSRCQRRSVCGVTRNNDVHRRVGSVRLAAASRTRSSGVNLGRLAVRRNTRSCCCKTRISRSLVASSAPGRTSTRVSRRTTNQSTKSIGGWYGVPGHDANLSFCAPQASPRASRASSWMDRHRPGRRVWAARRMASEAARGQATIPEQHANPQLTGRVAINAPHGRAPKAAG
jgi:hypothetical protein